MRYLPPAGCAAQHSRRYAAPVERLALNQPGLLASSGGSTQGRVDLDGPRTRSRLRERCLDATAVPADDDAASSRVVCVDEGGFTQHTPATMGDQAASFTEYQD